MVRIRSSFWLIVLSLAIVGLAIFSARGEPATAQQADSNAEACLDINQTTKTVTNTCSEPIEIFYCTEGTCGGNRYYGAWQSIDPQGRHQLQEKDVSGLQVGACPGHYFTATHSRTARYTCTNRLRSAPTIQNAERATPNRLKVCENTTPIEAFRKNRPVAAVATCADGNEVVYAIEYLGGEAFRIKVDNGPLIVLNNDVSTMEGQNIHLINWQQIGSAVCAKGPSTSVRDEVFQAIRKMVQSQVKQSKFRQRSSDCVGVRG